MGNVKMLPHSSHLASRNQAIEELEKSIAVAEAACPGITDKMVKKLIEKFQK